jgi:hypothetical protein
MPTRFGWLCMDELYLPEGLPDFAGSGVGTGTGTGTGAGADTGALVEAGWLCFFLRLSCFTPSPYMVMTIMKNTVVENKICQRVGFSRKNNGHFGLIIPMTKYKAVKIPKLIA